MISNPVQRSVINVCIVTWIAIAFIKSQSFLRNTYFKTPLITVTPITIGSLVLNIHVGKIRNLEYSVFCYKKEKPLRKYCCRSYSNYENSLTVARLSNMKWSTLNNLRPCLWLKFWHYRQGNTALFLFSSFLLCRSSSL